MIRLEMMEIALNKIVGSMKTGIATAKSSGVALTEWKVTTAREVAVVIRANMEPTRLRQYYREIKDNYPRQDDCVR